MSAITAEVSDKLAPVVRRVAEDLDGPGRVLASLEMGKAVQTQVVAHLFEIEPSRHGTAARLGAAPTGFIGQAAEAAAAGVVTADEDGVSLSMRHPVIARAWRDIEIVPKTARFLAIPIAAEAYGHSPRELTAQGRTLFAAKGTLFEKQEDGSILALYLLRGSVRQLQDRSLMPSDDEITTAAAEGCTHAIRQVIQKNGLQLS